MCGIAGFTHAALDAQRRDEVAEAMIARLAHRGPDDSGVWSDDNVAIGHRRLSIVDLAAGRQPMTGPRGACVAFNGEIYNYRELRETLEALGYIE